MSKELILLCEHFVNDHPMDGSDDFETFDAQEFFEGVTEEELIEFFRDIYFEIRNM